MIELPMVFLAGILGSAHCLGMCGGFALSIGSGARNSAENLARQAAYGCGRIFTYTSLGAVAGFFGLWLTRRFPALTALPAVLAIAAGCLLAFQGAATVWQLTPPDRPWKRRLQRVIGRRAPSHPPRSPGNCPAQAQSLITQLFRGLLGARLTGPGGKPTGRLWHEACISTFLAGVLTGFLPCGLLYAMLAMAAKSQSLLGGAALMGVFGAGTLPAMTMTGMSGSLLALNTRIRLFQLAGWCVLFTGILTIARGIAFLPWFQASGATCPLCG